MPSAKQRRRRPEAETPSPVFPEMADSRAWAPSSSSVFNLFLIACLVSVKFSNISDCDETYNYWEPTHFLIFDYGFQTWEYSPVYAVRSYAYNALHAGPAFLLSLFFNKVTVFYGVRAAIGIACAYAETYFYEGVLIRFGSVVAVLVMAFLVFASGMFVACCAYLPSSFAMIMAMVAVGAWLKGDGRVAVLAIAVASCLGWPFAAALGIPIALDILLRTGWRRFVIYAGVSGVLVLGPQVILDSFLYRRIVVAPLNIVLYNVFGQGGPDLYGVEPFSFYFKNAFLNMNVVFLLALISLPLWVVRCLLTRKPDMLSWSSAKQVPTWLSLMPMYLWMVIFFTRPHKEERFLFPIYPLFCLAAALCINTFQEFFTILLFRFKKLKYGNLLMIPGLVLAILHTTLAVSRSVALCKGYHAPLDVYGQLYYHAVNESLRHPTAQYNVCIGKEWYRFPSNFFLPDRRWQVQFLRSEFRGQLPQPYLPSWNATFVIPAHMNDMNREETSRYVTEDQCDYIVDLEMPTSTLRQPRYAEMKDTWKVIFSATFLDAARSNPLARSFYIPFYSEKETKHLAYNVLQRINRRKRKPK